MTTKSFEYKIKICFEQLEIIVRKEENVCYQQFLLLPKCLDLLPDDIILDWSKLKQIADDILKCI